MPSDDVEQLAAHIHEFMVSVGVFRYQPPSREKVPELNSELYKKIWRHLFHVTSTILHMDDEEDVTPDDQTDVLIQPEMPGLYGGKVYKVLVISRPFNLKNAVSERYRPGNQGSSIRALRRYPWVYCVLFAVVMWRFSAYDGSFVVDAIVHWWRTYVGPSRAAQTTAGLHVWLHMLSDEHVPPELKLGFQSHDPPFTFKRRCSVFSCENYMDPDYWSTVCEAHFCKLARCSNAETDSS